MSGRLDLAHELASPLLGSEFESVLFTASGVDVSDAQEPPFFGDLNLDQVVESIVSGRDEYDLKPFFFTPLRDAEAVGYRQEIFRDLEADEALEPVCRFAEQMRYARQYLKLVEQQHFKYEQERWFLDAATTYHAAVSTLAADLAGVELGSAALRALREYLSHYSASERFEALSSELHRVRDGLDGVQYTARIKGGRVTVSAYHDEPDYSAEVEETFARFQQGAAESHLIKIPDSGSMDHVEARIVECVARLFPAEFAALDQFCARQRDFLDPRIARFDREVQFYLAYLEHMERLTATELPFCSPVVSAAAKASSAEAAFDIALAAKLVPERATVVQNDFSLTGPERILVVSGPNQGGKTTFARMFGQLHYLASLGLPVPGNGAQLFLADRVFTHFEVEEDISTLRGGLDDELVRVHDILEQASGDSIIVLNEIFASTTLADAVLLGTEVLKQIIELGCLAVCVTFVDELASLDPATVSMVATVAPDDPAERTFTIVRRPADGRAYAWALAEKYGLSCEQLKRRIGR